MGHNNNRNNKSPCVLYGITGCTGELKPLQLGEDIIPVGGMLFARHAVNLWHSLLESPFQWMLDPALFLVITQQLSAGSCARYKG